MAVMLYHKTEGQPLEKSEAKYRVFNEDNLPKKSEGWRETPAEALKVRKRGPDSA